MVLEGNTCLKLKSKGRLKLHKVARMTDQATSLLRDLKTGLRDYTKPSNTVTKDPLTNRVEAVIEYGKLLQQICALLSKETLLGHIRALDVDLQTIQGDGTNPPFRIEGHTSDREVEELTLRIKALSQYLEDV